LAKLLEQLSLESTDSQILSQVEDILKCKRNKTQEVMMNSKPKRYSQSRPLLDQYKSGLKLIKQSISGLEIITNSYEMNTNTDLLRSKTQKQESVIDSMNTTEKEMTESDRKEKERLEHQLIAQQIKELTNSSKQSHCNEMSNECKPNNDNNVWSQQFFCDLMDKSAKNSVIYGTQSPDKDLNNNQKKNRKKVIII
jgi:hypothetical protein